jgi:adenylate kinase family enzyme
MPFIIITCGPTGSGKTSLAEQTAALLNISDYDTLLIDDVIENNADYKQRVDEILQTCSDPKTCLSNPTPELYEKFTKAYFATRKLPNKECADQSCDDYFNEKIKKSLNASRNVVFESTCGYYPAWLLKDYAPESYDIVFSYSLVSLCNLIKRNSSRAETQLQRYLSDRTKNPAPRLPDVRYETMKKTVEGIKEVLISQTLGCTRKEAAQICVRPTRVLLFNNNAQMRLIFDSEKDDTEKIVGEIEKILNTSERCPIGGRRRRRTLRSKPRSQKRGKTVRH